MGNGKISDYLSEFVLTESVNNFLSGVKGDTYQKETF